MDNKIRINSFSGIKAIALLFIFWWHSTVPSPSVDLGARCCELFFVISGFLIGVTKKNSFQDYSWGESIKYILKKILYIYPLHLIVLLLQIPFCKDMTNFGYKFLLKALFLESWTGNQDIIFAFNGSAWFISSLLFCYFLSPLLIKILKSKIKSIISFFIVFVIRFFIEYVSKYSDLNYLNILVHVHPVVRALEFAMGVFISSYYFTVKEKIQSIENKKILFSLVEVFVLFGVVLFCISKTASFRVIYSLVFCIFVFSFDEGIISKFFSLKIFTFFSKYQFEFYLTHTTFLLYFNYLISTLYTPKSLVSVILINCCAVIVLFIHCVIYKFLYNKLLKNSINKLYSIILALMEL